jgi:hypothetical protein
MRKSSLVFIFIALSRILAAQPDTYIEFKPKIGFLAAHRSVMGHLATEHAVAGELSYLFKARGEKKWHINYGMPEYGASLFFGSVGNRELMGYYTGLFTFMRLPIIKMQNYRLSGSMGVGLAYASKIYDPEDSLLILSMGVGSRLNALVQLGINNQFFFGKHMFSLSFDMTHFSNGSTIVPNYGLNLPFLSLGYGYKIIESSADSLFLSKKAKPRWEYGVMGIASVKQINPVGGKSYGCFGLNLIGRRYFSGRSGLEMSFDFFSKQAILGFQPQLEKTQLDIIQLGMFAGYIMPLDRLHVIVGMGYYLRDKYQPEDPVYHRVGLRYVFRNGINANLVLKSHWARADYVEYGIGYTFRK